MKPLVIGALAVAGLGMVTFLFTQNASPYVDARTALSSKADNLHVVGKIVPGTLQESMGRAQFVLVDESGTKLPVAYQGEPVSNLGQSERVVAVGGADGTTFRAHKLLVKCPSRYNTTPNATKV